LLFYLKNDIDVEVVNSEYLQSYDFAELSVDSAIAFVQDIYKESLVSVDENGLFVFSSKSQHKLVVDFTDKSHKPYVNAVWDEDRRLWTLPVERLNSLHFSSVWDEETQKWISNVNSSADKATRTFYIWNAREFNEESPYAPACSTTDYVIQSMQEVTHGVDNIGDFVVEVAEDLRGNKYPKITKHFTVIDLSPIAMITYQEHAETDNELFAEAMKIHPQCVTRNIDELFRIIIEWAWSYRELGNKEPMAKMCDDILREVQMPLNVRNDLLSLRPQAVARYVLGDQNALEEREDEEPMPESFRLWISDVYYKYKSRTADSPLNVNTDSMKESYDR
jgi:hypothetical protein